VALTAGAFKSQQDAAHAAGMTHFISKPFDVPSTIAMILRLTAAAAAAQRRDARATSVQSTTSAPDDSSTLVLDWAQGLEIWGNAADYQLYLQRFVAEYQDAAVQIRQYLRLAQAPAAHALAHKLAGVAGSMALPQVLQWAIELDRLLRTEADGDQTLAQLDRALARAVVTILALTDPSAARP